MPGLENKAEGKYDFDGGCMPRNLLGFNSTSTFSVRIFKWLPKASGKGLKKGKEIFVHALTEDASKQKAGFLEGLNHEI